MKQRDFQEKNKIPYLSVQSKYDIESVAKRAFWNLNMPGCDEHYLVHRLWNEPCYISELSLAAEVDNKIVGAILYSKAKIKTIGRRWFFHLRPISYILCSSYLAFLFLIIS